MTTMMETMKKMAEKIDALEKKKQVTGHNNNTKAKNPEEILAARTQQQGKALLLDARVPRRQGAYKRHLQDASRWT